MRAALTVVAAGLALLLWFGLGLPRVIGYDLALASGADDSSRVVGDDGHVREYGHGLIRFNGKGPERWRWSAVNHYEQRRQLERTAARLRAENRRLRSELRRKHEPSLEHYFTIAALAYADGLRRHGYTREDLERRGRCESVNFTDFYNETPIYNGEHAQGVMGFIPSTFASTPFAGLDVRNDHLANIMAGAWMHANNRGNEWACR